MTERYDLVPYIDNARVEGKISEATEKTLKSKPVQRLVTLAMGTPFSQIPGDHPFIVTILVDDSGSNNRKRDRRTEGMVAADSDDPDSNAQSVRDAHRTILEGLRTSEHPERIIVSTQGLNSGVIDPYHRLSEAKPLDNTNYVPEHFTPLYRRAQETLSAVLIKSQEADYEWKEAYRTVTLIISDGGEDDRGSIQEGPTRAKDVAGVAADMQKTGRHILAAVGIDDGMTDFRAVFMGMGIPQDNILTATDRRTLLERIRAFTKATVRAANATEKEFLMLTDGGGFGKELARKP